MKLGTSIAFIVVLLAVCAGGGIFSGFQAYELGSGAVGSVSLPESRPDVGEISRGASGSGALISEAAILQRINAETDYSNYGPPPTPAKDPAETDSTADGES